MTTTDGNHLRLATGVAGLDEVLLGGFFARRAYMVRGGPGTGKTALGLHFLIEGVARGERVLYLTQGAPEEVVEHDAASIGLDTSRVQFLDFTPEPGFFSEARSYDIFSPAEAEREELTAALVDRIRAIGPSRVFLDALTQVRNLSTDLVDFRRQAHAFLRFLDAEGATVLFASGSSDPHTDEDLQFMSDGVLSLENHPRLGRTVTVSKLRGSGFRPGTHCAKISSRGFEVYPRLMPERHGQPFVGDQVPSGVAELDRMLHGGIERGTVTLLSGPSGVGKSTLGLQFMKEAAGRGERSVVYTFEESAAVLRRRAEAIGTPVGPLIDAGMLAIVDAEPLHYTPDQFALLVRDEIEARKASVVMIDSVAGYKMAINGEALLPHLHALCAYLRNMGATVIIAYETGAITGEFQITEIGMSYLADNIVFLRYVEMDGELRRVVGVLKKRLSDFEKTLRELTIGAGGLAVGEPLRGLRGVLSGLPTRDVPVDGGR
jgi:circadian clock protein KaiC